MIDSHIVEQLIKKGIEAAVAEVIDKLSLDPAWYARVEAHINQQMHIKVNRYTSQLDLDQLIQQNVDSVLANYFDQHSFVRTPGIDDQAQLPELTVMPGIVVAENELAAARLTVHGAGDVQGPLSATELRVMNRIHTDTMAIAEFTQHIASQVQDQIQQQWTQQLVSQVTELIRDQGIDIGRAHINGDALITGDRLTPNIRNTSIETVGVLRNLTVAGTACLADTVTVSNGRMGINDANPRRALSIQDQGATLEAGGLGADRAYLGASAGQSLCLGIDGTVCLEVDRQGSVAINDLRVNGNRIGFSNQVPGWAGRRGDLVFNSDPGPDRAFGWVCRESFQWQALRSAA